MSNIYKSNIAEEDTGYSIPKILVAILVLILIGTGTYIYFQQKKLKTSVAYLLNDKKQVELDLNSMIEKYNLAIDDNDFLADELREERDQIIQFRDSIQNVEGENFGNISDYEEQIKSLKDNSAIVFNNTSVETSKPTNVETIPEKIIEETIDDIPVKNKQTDNKKAVEENNIAKKVSNDITSTEETVIPTETIAEETSTAEVKTEEPEEITKVETPTKKVAERTNFVRVEVPPTYPGCKGSATEKKACFTKKVKEHLARKFDTGAADGYNLNPGKKRIWVSFDVDKFGNVVNINTRSPKDMPSRAKVALEKEATQVVKSLPKMTAARQNGNSVKIHYTVPITFIVE